MILYDRSSSTRERSPGCRPWSSPIRRPLPSSTGGGGSTFHARDRQKTSVTPRAHRRGLPDCGLSAAIHGAARIVQMGVMEPWQ